MSLLAQTDPLLDPNFEPEVLWFALSPLLVLVGGALLLMVAGALTPKWPKGLYAFASATTAGAAGLAQIREQLDSARGEGCGQLDKAGFVGVYNSRHARNR